MIFIDSLNLYNSYVANSNLVQHFLPLSPAVLLARGYTLDGFVLGRKEKEIKK